MSIRTYIVHRWGDYMFDGSLVEAEILSNPDSLTNLLRKLEDGGMDLIAFNDAGIIISYTEPTIDDKVYTIEERMNIIESDVVNHETRIQVLESNMIMPVDPVGDAEKHKDVTGEFYLLYGALPEDFKKKLKIYIKNDKDD